MAQQAIIHMVGERIQCTAKYADDMIQQMPPRQAQLLARAAVRLIKQDAASVTSASVQASARAAIDKIMRAARYASSNVD